MAKYLKQKNFSKEAVMARDWLAVFPCFNNYTIKKCIILSLIHEFELNGKDFDLTIEEIAKVLLMPAITIKRNILQMIKEGILSSEKTGRTRKLKIGIEQ